MHVGVRVLRLGGEGYVGWFCVDFVHDCGGALWPTEINVRMTGSAFVLAVQRRLRATRGHDVAVRSYDHHPLALPLEATELRAKIMRTCAAARLEGVEVVVTISTASRDARPTVGLLFVARSMDAIRAFSQVLDAAHCRADLL
jgi:hypothetical protein